MNREKLFINAFVIVILIVCILSTFIKSEEFEKLVYALIVPVFLITILEFIIEIKEKSQKLAIEKSNVYDKLSKLEYKTADLSVENLKLKGKFDEDNLPQNIQDDYENSIKDTKVATRYIKTSTAIVKLHKPLRVAYLITLILFFISIMFFNKVSNILKNIELNSIALWSLLLLLISIYYKDYFAAKVVEKLYNYYDKKENNKE